MGEAEKAFESWFTANSDYAEEVNGKGWALFQDAMDEALQAGRREMIPQLDIVTASATRIEDKGRREAFGEAAGVCNAIAETQCRHNGEAEHGADLCQEAIRALDDQPPPDTGWRDRLPTLAEHREHPDGVWLVEWVRGTWEDGKGAQFPEDGALQTTYLGGSSPIVCDEDLTFLAPMQGTWRPLRSRPVTRELYRAPWPKGEDDAKT